MIANSQEKPPVVGISLKVQCPIGCQSRILARIVDQVEQDLLDGRRIGQHNRLAKVIAGYDR
jgi:hypothetical protein